RDLSKNPRFSLGELLSFALSQRLYYRLWNFRLRNVLGKGGQNIGLRELYTRCSHFLEFEINLDDHADFTAVIEEIFYALKENFKLLNELGTKVIKVWPGPQQHTFIRFCNHFNIAYNSSEPFMGNEQFFIELKSPNDMELRHGQCASDLGWLHKPKTERV
ncbi:MAG: hypothetical protein OXT67_12790, partial [Zetaproteobacteria bacterium]|nr:hypothetical protein [Zetaproteobacteria bacterium]